MELNVCSRPKFFRGAGFSGGLAGLELGNEDQTQLCREKIRCSGRLFPLALRINNFGLRARRKSPS